MMVIMQLVGKKYVMLIMIVEMIKDGIISILVMKDIWL